jgi:hypothetical protein
MTNTVLDASWADMTVIGRGTYTVPASSLGGLVGSVSGTSTVSNSFALGDVTGTHAVGGLVGTAQNTVATDRITFYNVYATGDVYALAYDSRSAQDNSQFGGLVGNAVGVGISASYVHATGDVGLPAPDENGQVPANYKAPRNDMGGLFGSFGGDYRNGAAPGTLSYAYATGNVNMSSGIDVNTSGVGGLIGSTGYYTQVSNSYALGDVTGGMQTGGLIGVADRYSAISDSYAGGAAYAPLGVGGLIGTSGNYSADVTVTNSYWNADANSNVTTGFSAPPTNSDGSPVSITGLTGVERNDTEIIGAIVSGNDPVATVINPRIEAARQAEADRLAREEEARQAEEARLAEEAQAARLAEAARQATLAAANTASDSQQLGAEQAAQTQRPAVTLGDAAPPVLDGVVLVDLSRAGGRSYSASLRTVTAEGTTYLIDEEEAR